MPFSLLIGPEASPREVDTFLPLRRLRCFPEGSSSARSEDRALGSPPFRITPYRCGRRTLDHADPQVKGVFPNSQGRPQGFFVVHRTNGVLHTVTHSTSCSVEHPFVP